MALYSLGKNAAAVHTLRAVTAPDPVTVAGSAPADVDAANRQTAAVAQQANDTITKTRGDIQKSLAAWIPGDFLVVYATLLAAWPSLRGDFRTMLWFVVALPIVFVVAGAFAIDGFKVAPADRKQFAATLAVRIGLGMVASLIATVTVPTSGWYGLDWFKDHDSSVITTVGIGTGILLLILTGLQKRGLITAG